LRAVAGLPDLSGTRYQNPELLGRGGMGAVYRVEDGELGREVALKVLSDPDPAGDLGARLLGEARHLARLEHPSIVPVHDVGRLADSRPYYVMKLVRGKRLDAWRRENPPRPVLLRLFVRICDAVAFAHARGVIHRDLKPENIMVGEFGEALVMDWGIARALDDPAEDEGAIIGTPAYMAPEQARGLAGPLDPLTDVHALGAVLRFLLVGRPPVPRALAATAARAMAPEPGGRYASASDLAADVERFLDGLPVAAHRETPLERAARVLGRQRTLVFLLLAYLFMRLVTLLWFRR
jgi:serine/threonine protein kinase